MGGSICNICARCDEYEKENEMTIAHEKDEKPLALAKPIEQQNNRYSVSSYPFSEIKINQDSNKEFSLEKLLYEQSKYGSNETVRKIEEKLGNFPFDSKKLNDDIPKIMVGPKEIESNTFYYGYWNPSTDERHGYGMQIWPDGSKYVGYWKNDRTNGQGRLIHRDGDVYVGEWKDDLAHGLGEYTDAAGMKYRGQWVKDQQEGAGNRANKLLGREEWPDGAIYEGSYSHSMKNGKGKFNLPDGSSYEGYFKDDLIEGKGTYRWSDGKECTGEWLNEKMNGKGTYRWPDGRVYIGEFVDNLKDGYGVMTWSHGERYEGNWKGDKMHGKGKIISADGREQEGIWDNGTRISDDIN